MRIHATLNLDLFICLALFQLVLLHVTAPCMYVWNQDPFTLILEQVDTFSHADRGTNTDLMSPKITLGYTN